VEPPPPPPQPTSPQAPPSSSSQTAPAVVGRMVCDGVGRGRGNRGGDEAAWGKGVEHAAEHKAELVEAFVKPMPPSIRGVGHAVPQWGSIDGSLDVPRTTPEFAHR
jgi:hypothetical protein